MVEWDQLGKGWRSRFGINVILSTGWIKYTTITDYEELEFCSTHFYRKRGKNEKI